MTKTADLSILIRDPEGNIVGNQNAIGTTDDEGVFDADDVTWSTSTITARGAIVYKSTGTAANDLLICYFDFGADKSSSAGNFTITWNAEGIVNLG